MGGGSKQNTAQTTSDNDIMAAEGATIVGDSGSYYYADSSIDLGIGSSFMGNGAKRVDGNEGVIVDGGGDYSSVELGMGSTMVGDGSTSIQDNQGTIFGDGADINYGIKIGENSSYVQNSMDSRTQDLLDNALTLMYANTENVLEASAAQAGQIDAPTFLNPTNDGLPTNPTNPATQNNELKYAAGATLLILAAMAIKGRSK